MKRTYLSVWNRNGRRGAVLAGALATVAAGWTLSEGGIGSGVSTQDTAGRVDPRNVRAELLFLASDSLGGRRTGSVGSRAAAEYIASRLAAFGVEPAGDDGYFQMVPMARTTRRGRPGAVLLPAISDLDTVPAERRLQDVNVVGVVRGRDPAVASQAIVVGAHHDHVGMGRAISGDSIYNGADDDASGVVAVLEVARALTAGSGPRRTVVLLLSTGEELGLLGTRWYLEHPVVPLAHTVADLQVEMIGRPDSLAGGAGGAWLTGYERSTVGKTLTDAGLAVVPDPRPDMSFFQRSDNYPFALLGIPGHTLSSYNMHTDYHQPSDEFDKIDLAHMTAVIESTIRAVELLANRASPEWLPGGRPQPRRD